LKREAYVGAKFVDIPINKAKQWQAK